MSPALRGVDPRAGHQRSHHEPIYFVMVIIHVAGEIRGTRAEGEYESLSLDLVLIGEPDITYLKAYYDLDYSRYASDRFTRRNIERIIENVANSLSQDGKLLATTPGQTANIFGSLPLLPGEPAYFLGRSGVGLPSL